VTGRARARARAVPAALRPGCFANLTHSTPIVGVAQGFHTVKPGSTKFGADVFADGPTR
jgi:hypothetical protein